MASGEVDAERNGAATVPALAGGDAANERDAVTLDRDVCASGADSPHMGGAVAGDRDGRCFALPHILPDARANCSAQRAPGGTVHGGGHPKGHRHQRRAR